MAQSKKTLASIPVNEVEVMVKTYYAYSKVHDTFDPHTHVRCVWFPAKQMLEMFEQFKKEVNDPEVGADGIRIYLGRYPNDVKDFEDPKPKPNTNSVIFVATRKADGKPKTDYFTDMPFAPENRGEQCQPECGGSGFKDE